MTFKRYCGAVSIATAAICIFNIGRGDVAGAIIMAVCSAYAFFSWRHA